MKLAGSAKRQVSETAVGFGMPGMAAPMPSAERLKMTTILTTLVFLGVVRRQSPGCRQCNTARKSQTEIHIAGASTRVPVAQPFDELVYASHLGHNPKIFSG